MQFYASPDEEAAAVRRAAARAGCRLRAVEVRSVVGEPMRVASSMSCRDGWMAGKLLLALAIEDARTPGAAKLAAELRAKSSSDEDFARAIHAMVLERVRFKRETAERFESGGYTLEAGEGDCDAHFRLIYAVAVAGGLPASLALLHHGPGSPPAHAVTLLDVDGVPRWAETSVRAFFGEEPNAAARRLGVTSDRSDIAREVRIMKESDLAPLPKGFRERNNPAQVRRDAEALQRLGFLGRTVAASMMTDPTATVLRKAVAEYQRSRGLVVDGLLGPTTRMTLARDLSTGGPPIGELDAPPPSAVRSLPIRLSSDVSDEFLREVHAFAARFRERGATARTNDWLRVWNAESGVKNITNLAGHAYAGLNQMGVRERRAVGFMGTPAEWLSLSLSEQLPYVERFYLSAAKFAKRLGAGAFRDAPTIYLANIAPAHMDRADDPGFAIYSAPSVNYEANKVFDREKKGYIAIRDLEPFVARAAGTARFRELEARSDAIASERPSRPEGGGGLGGSVAVLAAFAGMGSLAYWVARS